MLILIKLLMQFIIAITIIFPLYFLINHFKSKTNKRQIKAPELIPFIGNIHVIASLQILQKMLTLCKKYSLPIRIKCFTYETIIIDSPDDIRKIEFAYKSDLYQATPYNNGLVSMKGEL